MHKFLFFLFIFPFPLLGQLNFDKTYDTPVTINGNLINQAWTGGLNNPQISNIDLNNDGILDLFLFDRSGNVKLVFLVENNNGEINYVPDTGLPETFPEFKDWVLLADYNQDGKADIFTHSSEIAGGGIAVYKNTSVGSTISFELMSGLLQAHAEFESGGIDFPLFVNAADIPSFLDVDEDGDMDILTFAVSGAELEYYENQSQELFGDNEHLIYELKNTCWGYFREGALDNAITLFDTCQNNVINPKSFENNAGIHVGSTVLSLDLNGDLIKDLLIGDVTSRNLIALINGGTLQSAGMTGQFPDFPTNTVGVDIQTFPAAFYVDVDADNINDLLVTPNASNISNNFKATWLYKNNGININPDFSFESRGFLQDDMIERGSNAFPVFFDYNSDGKPDLVVGDKSFFNNSGNQHSKLALYENTGSENAPAFELIDDNYLNLEGQGLTLALYPAFGDLDNDGDEDLIIGDLGGNLFYFENMAGEGNVADFVLTQAGITDANGVIIDVGQFATPFIVDIDRNGTNDLVIGERNGNLNYYENTGTLGNYQFTLISESWGGIQLPGELNDGFSVPFILDSPGGYHLFLGSSLGTIPEYFPIENNLTGDFNLSDENILPNYEGSRTALTMTQLTGDDAPELIVGNLRGGLGYYLGSNTVEINNPDFPEFQVHLFPNPANDFLRISIEINSNYELRIYSIQGTEVIHRLYLSGKQKIDIGSLPAGVYLLQISIGNQQIRRKFVKINPNE